MKKASYRSSQDVDSWRSADIPLDRYAYPSSGVAERYHRDDYDVPPPREPNNNWGSSRTNDFPPPASSREDWSSSYAAFSSYNGEYPSWNAHDGHSSSYNQRHQDDHRGRPNTTRRTPRPAHRADVGDDTEQWRTRAAGVEEHSHGWEGDNGWLPRRHATRTVDPPVPVLDDAEERKWEPAPSWKSSHREAESNQGSYSRSQNGNNNNSRNGYSNSYKTSSHHSYTAKSGGSSSGKKTHQTHSSKAKYVAESDWRSRDESSDLNKYGFLIIFVLF